MSDAAPPPAAPTLPQRIVVEAVGTVLLLAVVVGSGIMAERLCAGNVGLALLCNALATGGGLVALILTFGPVSGAHFNPAVSLADAASGGLRWRDVPGYLLAQVLGAIIGVSRRTPAATPYAVAAYIVSAYWFTASTSFANPAVTLARAHRHLRGHSSGGRPWLYRRAVGRRSGCDGALFLAGPSASERFMTHVVLACVHNAGRGKSSRWRWG